MDAVPPRASQAARDALLIQGMTALSVAATAIVTLFLDGRGEEQSVVLSMGLAAALGFGGWSALLAFGAIRHGDFSRHLGVVFSLCLLELAAIISRFGFIAAPDEDCLIVAVVAVPVLSLAAIAGVPVAWWRTRRAERREAGKGIPGTGLAGRWLRVVLWVVSVTVLFSVVLVPCPLFLCSVSSTSQGLAQSVVRSTPVVVGDVSTWLVSLSDRPFFVELHRRALKSGRVSTTRLVASLSSRDDGVQRCAFLGLTDADPETAVGISIRIGNGQLSVPSCDHLAGKVVGERGAREEIVSFLETATTRWPSASFSEYLRFALCNSERTELVPDLERLCKGNPPNRAVLLESLAGLAPAGQAERLWVEFLSDSDPGRQGQAKAAIGRMRDKPVQVLLLMLVIPERPGAQLREDPAAWANRWIAFVYQGLNEDERLRLVKAVLTYIDHDNPHFRTNAALFLAHLPGQRSMKPLCSALYSRYSLGLAGQDTDAEGVQLRQQVKEHAQKWLEYHERAAGRLRP